MDYSIDTLEIELYQYMEDFNIEIGKTYLHADNLKSYKAALLYGDRYVFLPLNVNTKFEHAPIVIGPRDINFFKKLIELDQEHIDQRIKQNKKVRLMEDLKAKEYSLEQSKKYELDIKESIQEIKEELEKL